MGIVNRLCRAALVAALACVANVGLADTWPSKPIPQLPNVPPIGDTLPSYEAEVWYGVIAPAGTPRAVIEKLSSEIARIVGAPAVIRQTGIRAD